MKVDRCIRAYHKQTETLAFEILLPSDCLTFLSTVDFLVDGSNCDPLNYDPLLYYSYELTKDETDYLLGHWHLLYQADIDYFDYFLECDSVPAVSKVKTKEEVSALFLEDYTKFLHKIFDEGVELKDFQDLGYQIYLQGVSDGRL